MATFWIVCAVLSHITQDAWSYRYSRLRNAQKGLQNGEYQMSWNNFNSGFRSMSTCPFGPCEVWDSNSYDHPSSNLLKSHEIRKMSVFIFFAQKNEYWFWLDFYFLFDENLLQTFSHNFLQESNQFQQKCFLLPALANMVSFVSIFWENVMKYVKKKRHLFRVFFSYCHFLYEMIHKRLWAVFLWNMPNSKNLWLSSGFL